MVELHSDLPVLPLAATRTTPYSCQLEDS